MHVNHIRLANPEHSCPPFSTPLFKWNKTVSSHQQWHSQFRNPAASIKPDWRHSFEVRLSDSVCQLSTLNFQLCLGCLWSVSVSAASVSVFIWFCRLLFPLCLRLRCFELFNSSTRKLICAGSISWATSFIIFLLNSCWWLSDKSALVGAYVWFKEDPAFPSEWQSDTRKFWVLPRLERSVCFWEICVRNNFAANLLSRAKCVLVIICAGIVVRNWNNLVVLPELK